MLYKIRLQVLFHGGVGGPHGEGDVEDVPRDLGVVLDAEDVNVLAGSQDDRRERVSEEGEQRRQEGVLGEVFNKKSFILSGNFR